LVTSDILVEKKHMNDQSNYDVKIKTVLTATLETQVETPAHCPRPTVVVLALEVGVELVVGEDVVLVLVVVVVLLEVF
jgi:hypothetical protein